MKRWPNGYPSLQFNGRTVFRDVGAGERMAAGRRREDLAFAYLGLRPPVRTGPAPMSRAS